MRPCSPVVALLALFCLPAAASAASFTYRGQLHDDGEPAQGRYDLRLGLYADAHTRTPLVRVLVLEDVEVSGGQFEVPLEFPGGAVLPDSGWLQVEVRGPGESLWWPLPGRQSVVLKAQLCPESWALAGNSLTNSTTNFLGTTDAQPLDLRVNNQRALRLQPGPAAPSLIGGHHLNSASGFAAVVAGGGTETGPNSASGNYSAIGGGWDNAAPAEYGTVAGGASNSANGSFATVSGGFENRASEYGVVAGGAYNTVRANNGVVSGGSFNCAGGVGSWVGGYRAKVRPATASTDPGCDQVPPTGTTNGDQGTFVWADLQGEDFTSTGINQFLVRAEGGFGLNTANIPAPVELAVSTDSGNVDVWLRPATAQYGINLAAFGDATSAALYVARYNGATYTDYALWQADGRLRVFFDNPIKPTAGSWAAPSDTRLKQRVRPLDGALDRLLALRGVSFEYRDDAPNGYYVAGRHMGFLAQEVESVFPEWVSRDAAGYRLVASQGFDALTVEALRDLSERNASLREEIAALRARQEAELLTLRMELTKLRNRLVPAVAAKEP